ncbi:ABC transporter ATP-binding protein [Paenirhodobacter populi]|uniref:ABC transporter ATP-binding protein n=1 Tax=Paenirhodobacter populi TaxID=2306993 RepID=UPI0019D4D8E0|nr:ABC transporter ATP-binding protein [Sinirhodobacter populi]
MTEVDISGVAKRYGTAPVLTDISAQFPKGSFTSLLGPSGSKTTLLRIVAGFVSADSGRVTIAGRDVTRTQVWARNIGMVFQSCALFPHMTVAQNVAFGLGRRGIRGSEAAARAERALDMVRLPGFVGRLPKQLSGGQQQRVAMARAIVTEPTVLLLDEPLSALDLRLRQEMLVELLRIQREIGLTTIFVTHDQEEALTLSDTIAILDKGRIVQSGAPTAIYEAPRRFAAQFLGDSNFLTGHAEAGALRLADGTVLRAASPLPKGEGTAAVRPEKISLIPAGDRYPKA